MHLLETLRAKLADIQAKIEGVQNNADAESRDLTDDETAKLETLFSDFDTVTADIARRERIEANAKRLDNAGPGRQVPAAQPQPQMSATSHETGRTNAQVTGGAQTGTTPGMAGFRNFGEFALAVHQGSRPGAQAIDPRLQAPTTQANEGTGADGGFAVPPDFREEIQTRVFDEDPLVSRTDQLTSSSNVLTLPKDEAEPWLTGGVRAFWVAEAAAITQSKPALLSHSTALHKLAALVPVTEELLEDAPAMDRFLRRKTPGAMISEVNEAIINGNGTTQPEGLLTGSANIEVAKEAGQTADTFNYANARNMWLRLHAQFRQNAVWLMHQDVEAQLMQMVFEIKDVAGTENVGGQAVYLPQGSVAGQPFDTLFGRPILYQESCQILGDAGDVILTDLSAYMTVQKVGGIRADMSMHLFFDYDVQAFRFILRIGGESWLSAVISPRNGATTRSNIVSLAARA